MGQKINQRIFRANYQNNTGNFLYNNHFRNKYTNYSIKNHFIYQLLSCFFYLFNIILNDIKLIYLKNTLILKIKFYTLFLCNFKFLKKIVNKLKKKELWFKTFLNLKYKKFYCFLINKVSIILSDYLKKNNIKFLVSILKEKSVINLSTEYQKISYFKLKLQLRKYLSTSFFKECFCILLSLVKLRNFSDLFAFYVKLEFNKLKKHNFFLTFLKRALIFFVYSTFSKIKGIKVLIKGRLNGKPRSSNKLIQVGSISSQSFESNISSTQTTSFSVLGTFGIKIWVCEN